MEVALVIDDRTENLADKDQAADGWREWLRISNALNLREQPTIITAITEAERRRARRTTSKPRTVPDDDFGGAASSPAWQAAHDLAMSGR